MATWGGNAIYEGGRYHLFAAAMLNGCGLESWGSNSYIVRAEADNITGPFTAMASVLGPFAHNPTVRHLPDGSVLLYMIGDGTGRTPRDCTNGSSFTSQLHLDTLGGATAAPLPPGTVGTGIFVAHAPSVHGPWEVIEVTSPNSSRSDDLCGGWTNPSPHVAPDGSVTLAFQSSRCEPFPVGKHYVALIGTAQAPTWRGPYSLLSQHAVNKEQPWCPAGQAEDPFLWRSARGWHLLMHGMCPTGVAQARYAFSLDAATWHNSPRQAYSYRVEFDDGTYATFVRMERPQLGFSKGRLNTTTGAFGAPDVLYNGVCDGPLSCLGLNRKGVHYMTWTLARPLESAA